MDITTSLKEILFCLVGVALLTDIAFASTSDSGTLTPGTQVTCPGDPLNHVYIGIGYDATVYGSYSPLTLTGGHTVTELRDVGFGTKNPLFCGPIPATSQSYFQASGFSADPGSGWLISITCNGVQQLESAAVYDGYSGGKAQWEWPHSAFGFASGTAASCTIVHN